MDRTRTIPLLYHLLLILSTVGIPLLILFAFQGSGAYAGYGWIVAAASFLVLLAYTLITNRNRRQS
ncbi:hypothetical protein [Desmospora activa]|uniref:Uncharacterized protein n=1 Tax=Desmospora activa DSM 45169 TaxID=1121389 RepID=A0A2T4Z769_9BACL|nr:hypothetical protein [Desmospora activa]PTM57734.1 hypothetical protein C8J48_0286 [Desmospora activa DSM 45169]